MELNEILSKFQKVKRGKQGQYMCLCPSHADNKASLAITEDGDKILLHCFAGCDTKEILGAVGLSEKDLFNNTNSSKSQIVAEYIYRDENNKTLYKVMRFEPKSFIQAKYNNGNWEFTMKDVRHVLYNLPQVISSDTIYWVEGEKDADNLISLGLVATTSVGGAQGFDKYKDDYVKSLEGKTVFIIPDNDDAGKKYACTVMKALKGIAKSVKILDLSISLPDLPPKSDISDVIKKYGKDFALQMLEELKTCHDFSIYAGQHINLKMMKDILKSLKISVKYNEITKETEVLGLPKEYSKDSSLEVLPALLGDICTINHIKHKASDIKEELLLISNSNVYNPIQDMLVTNKWDKQDRFPTLFEILGISDDELSKILVRKWMYQTTMIVFNNDEHLFGIDGVLVFQGNQGIGKTRFIRNLAINSDWFKEGAIIDLNNKDSIIEATKGWIVELGELDSTLKKKQSALKAFLTNSMDEVRVPYGRKSIKKPRRTSFFASVNPDEFLVDPSGNRRYWTVPLTRIDNDRLEKLGKDFITQLWLQAYSEIKDNPQGFRLTDNERKQLDELNNNYSEFIPCEEEITLKMIFDGKVQIEWTTVEINEKIFEGKSSATLIGRALSKIRAKYPDIVSMRKTKKGRVYILPIKKN